MDEVLLTFKLDTILKATAIGFITHPIVGLVMKTGLEGVDYYGEAHLSKWNALMHTAGMPFTIYGFVISIPALFGLPPYKANRLISVLYGLYGGHYLYTSIPIGMLYYLVYGASVIRGLLYYKETYLQYLYNLEFRELNHQFENTQDGNSSGRGCSNSETDSVSDSVSDREADIESDSYSDSESECYKKTVAARGISSPYWKLLKTGLMISSSALIFQELIGHWVGGDIPSRVEAIPNAILYAKFFSLHHLFY